MTASGRASTDRPAEPDGGVYSDVGPFAILPMWLLDRLQNPQAIRVYALLAGRYTRRSRTTAWPARARIAAELRISLDTVDRAIRDLMAAGALAVSHRNAPDNDHKTNVYALRTAHPDGARASIADADGRTGAAIPLDLDPVDGRKDADRDDRKDAAQSIEREAESLDSATLRPSGELAKTRTKDVATIFEAYRTKIQPGARLVDEARKKITTRLGTYSIAELLDAVDRFSRDEWWMEKNARQGAAWFFRSDSQIDRFLALEPEADNARRRGEDAPTNGRYAPAEPAPGLIATYDIRTSEFADITRA